MFEVSQYDLTTRTLMSEAMAQVKDADHDTYCARLIIAQTFVAQASSALPVDRIIQLGTVLVGFESLSEAGRARVQAELTKMARGKFLRSRRHQGKTLYEVNY